MYGVCPAYALSDRPPAYLRLFLLACPGTLPSPCCVLITLHWRELLAWLPFFWHFQTMCKSPLQFCWFSMHALVLFSLRFFSTCLALPLRHMHILCPYPLSSFVSPLLPAAFIPCLDGLFNRVFHCMRALLSSSAGTFRLSVEIPF